jgi:UDPglucose 6-dehydrogenase
MDVSIVGLGKLGMPLAASFAMRGIRVVGVDSNPDVIRAVHDCKPLTYEPGLADAMREAGSMLLATTDVRRAVEDTDITIILVPTPSLDDGTFSLEYVLRACRELGQAIRMCKSAGRYHTVVISSTVMPGSCDGAIQEALEYASGRQVGDGLGLCYCPEFVALGNALDGFLRPDFVLIGQSDAYAGTRLEVLYLRFCPNRPPIYHTSLVNAEIAKVALNFAVTAKITVANELAELCEHIPGAHVDEVTNAVGLDSRIGRRYFRGGTGFGGACFPRDVEAMLALSRSSGIDALLPRTIRTLNQWQFERIIQIVAQEQDNAPDAAIGILGLAFKPGTDVTEMSTGMALVEAFNGVATVYAYDPHVRHALSVDTVQEAVGRAHIVVVTYPHEAFQRAKFHEGQVVIDCWRCLDRALVEDAGARYWAIGVGDERA